MTVATTMPSWACHSICKALRASLDVFPLFFQVEKTKGQEVLKGPLPSRYVCRSVNYQIHISMATTYITVDLYRFEIHLREGLHM